MTTQDITNAIRLLRRVVVHGHDLEVLIATVEALEAELNKRTANQ